MACTTILVGKKASYDSSTMIARNDDNPTGTFSVKKASIMLRGKMPKIYRSKISHCEVELKEDSYRFSYVPSVKGDSGIWGASGINEYNVSMTATETITANYLVLAKDPYVKYDKETKKAGGIGEEDILMLVLPYIKSAKDGIIRLGKLLEKYGTYEPNGIAFADENEVWYLETIGGHHYIAKRLDDDKVAVLPNQLNIDEIDFKDATSKTFKNNYASKDIVEFIKSLNMDPNDNNPRHLFGTHSDSDHDYNTPRAWIGYKYLNCYKVNDDKSISYAKDLYTPISDDIPFQMIPQNKLKVDDVKRVLADHYQNTDYDPYLKYKVDQRNIYRPIGISRTATMSILQIRGYIKNKRLKAINWLSFSSNVFNTLHPFYNDVSILPNYISKTPERVDTSYFYWASRIIAVLVDPHYQTGIMNIERYQNKTMELSQNIINEYDKLLENEKDDVIDKKLLEANDKISKMIKDKTDDCLDKSLYNASMHMKNGFSRNDN